jgi:hypothetical protein
MSQTTKIHEHLKTAPITPLEALRKYKCFRLAARIDDLRKEGVNVKTEIVRKGKKHFAKYYL